MENIGKIIRNVNKTYISLDEIEKLSNLNDYLKLVDIINDLEKNGVITPVKNKNNTNGRIPMLYMKYRILKDFLKDEELENEIKHLSSEIKVQKYLKNKEIYSSHRERLLQLDTFLKTSKDKLNVRLSKNERAYQIWNYEKFLDTKEGKSIVSYNELEEKLNFYLTPEPFFDFLLNNKTEMTLLIIENKDTWYTLRKIARDMNLRTLNILGTSIDGIIYGEGNKITAFNAIKDYEKEMLNTNAKFIYWGDVDFSGIDMYERLRNVNLKSNIKLFSAIYEKMLDLTEDKELEEIHKGQNKNVDIVHFINEFQTQSYKLKLKKLLEEGKYIPQEILNYEELLKIIEV